ncbi:ATP-binding protein [Ruegeria arenilitoris]|uniref:ATP-binding protein n=1 Tax=Ruegeria arenilitoris TaxID=1173585 RepID=UPI00147EE50A|nr:ATP-binding protein [Ruegeria arenilitoris]
MPDTAFKNLLARLEASPENLTLRLAVMRRAMALGLDSRALELAFDIQPNDVGSADDRNFVAQVFATAGLDEEAELWGHPATEDQIPVEAEADATPDTTSETAPIEEEAANVVSLQVVGGQSTTDAEDTDDQISFADVGGLENVKRDIERRIIAPFKQSGLLSRFRKKSGGGVLMYGPPGCGKTMIARATAGECGARFQSVAISDILDPYWGVAEQRLTSIFEQARNNTPTILFFDEIDALGSKRSGHTSTHVSQMVSHFLAQMDGVNQRNDGVLVLAATNIPWSMDSAFLRPGRFDRMFFVPPPDAPAREAILRMELAGRPAETNVRFEKITAATSGYSGADLAQIIDAATDLAIDATLASNREVPINMQMLETAAKQVRPSTIDWLTTARNHATYSNESGRYDDVLEFLKVDGRR